jgi:hypothetical protein
MLNFSLYQSGIDFNCPYSKPSFKPLTPLIGLWQGLFSDTVLRASRNPLIELVHGF